MDPFHDIVHHLTINCTPLIDIPWLLKTKEVVPGSDCITPLSEEPAEKKMKFDEQEEMQEDQDREETKQDKNKKKFTANAYTPLKVKTVQISSNCAKKNK